MNGWKTYHLPAKFSVMMAMNRSREPRMARWIMTGRSNCEVELASLAPWLGPRYLRLKRSGMLKSSCVVSKLSIANAVKAHLDGTALPLSLEGVLELKVELTSSAYCSGPDQLTSCLVSGSGHTLGP